MITYKIGEFEVTGNKLLACDPCYIKKGPEPFYNVLIENVLPGTYVATVTVFDNEETDGLGDRNAEITICHKDYDVECPTELITDEVNFVGVDSGQALFIDKKHYDEYMDKSEEEQDAFYWACGDTTAKTDINAGILSGIPVTSTGYGDGCYNVYVEKNDDKKIVAASIVFIYEDEIECDEQEKVS